MAALLMVDAAATRDRDDAFAVTRTAAGWQVQVHIANVADVVPVAGRVDGKAFSRRASVYRRTGTTPMLGADVEAAATLVPGRDRPTVRFDIDLDHTGAVTAARLARGSTGDRAVALTYLGAAAALADPAAPHHGELRVAQQLAGVLLARRRDAGALAIYDLVHGLATTEEGNLIALAESERATTYMVVAELMILANTVGAGWTAERELPILYRNHRPNPVAAGTAELTAQIVASLDDPGRLQDLRQRLALTIGKASYDPAVHGHHGLRLPWYAHLTSPLRRWPDLASQRILLAAVDGAPAPYTTDQITTLAADFNARDTAARAATSAHLKAADHAHTLRIAAAATDLATLDDDRWFKTLKLAVHAATPPPAVAAELRRRDPAPRDLALLLAAPPGWAELRDQIFAAGRAAAPELGPSVLSMYLQPAGRVVRYHDAQAGPPHQPVFAAQAVDQDLTTTWCHAASKKLARQSACWQMLAIITGTTPAGDPDSRPDLPPPPPTKAAPTRIDPTGRNPVSVLNEYAQQHQLPAPTYTYRVDGTANEPTFTATATLDQHTADGTGPTKNTAKTAAAAHLLPQLALR